MPEQLHSNTQKTGILGGGQLGRMMLAPAIQLNLNLHFLDPDPAAPCSQLTPHFAVGDLQHYADVMAFGADKSVLSIEIEKVNTEAMAALAAKGVRVYPQPAVVKLIQDKRLQKQFYADHGFPTAPFVLLENETDLLRHTGFLPAFQKAATDGYDGRGVQRLNTAADFAKALPGPGLLEKAVAVAHEVSVIVARNPRGQMAAYPPVELVYHPEQNLVDMLFFPARIAPEKAREAETLAKRLVEALDFVGLLAVEMFIDQQGQLLLNEMAPRPHNSGHHSIEAFHVSQFEQHLRAIHDLPLGSVEPRLPYAAMINLLGATGAKGKPVYAGLSEMLRVAQVHPHIYGKQAVKPFRKMGHVTVTGNTEEEVLGKLAQIRSCCWVTGEG